MIGRVIGVVDRRNGIKNVGRKREVTGDEVEGTDEGLGLLDRVERGMALQLSHHGGNSVLTAILISKSLQPNG